MSADKIVYPTAAAAGVVVTEHDLIPPNDQHTAAMRERCASAGHPHGVFNPWAGFTFCRCGARRTEVSHYRLPGLEPVITPETAAAIKRGGLRPGCGRKTCPCRTHPRPPCDEWQSLDGQAGLTERWCPRCGWARHLHPDTDSERRALMTACAHGGATRCWPCQTGGCFSAPTLHVWWDSDDVKHAAATGQPAPSGRCGCAFCGKPAVDRVVMPETSRDPD